MQKHGVRTFPKTDFSENQCIFSEVGSPESSAKECY